MERTMETNKMNINLDYRQTSFFVPLFYIIFLIKKKWV